MFLFCLLQAPECTYNMDVCTHTQIHIIKFFSEDQVFLSWFPPAVSLPLGLLIDFFFLISSHLLLFLSLGPHLHF